MLKSSRDILVCLTYHLSPLTSPFPSIQDTQNRMRVSLSLPYQTYLSVLRHLLILILVRSFQYICSIYANVIESIRPPPLIMVYRVLGLSNYDSYQNLATVVLHSQSYNLRLL